MITEVAKSRIFVFCGTDEVPFRKIQIVLNVICWCAHSTREVRAGGACRICVQDLRAGFA
jgi:hypothetical protein